MTDSKITRTCKICGKEFTKQTKFSASTTCSIACRNIARKKPILTCRECGKEFTRNYWQIKQGRIYFCSRECGFKHGKPFEKKFWANIEKSETCWLWRGTLSNRGYGTTRFNGRNALAHRVSFEIHNEPIPEGMCILHICDTPACVNPAHLKLGTFQENITDCVNKDRQCRGERNGHAIFTDETVKEARRLRADGFTYVELSKHFNISRQTISQAVRGKTWKHVKS